MVYIFRTFVCQANRHISSIHTSIAILSSVMTSIKHWKIKHFTTFHTIKNHQYSTIKSIKTLENKAFHRTQPKITLIIRKFHITNYQKSNLKNTKTPVKSTIPLSNVNQNFTLLSKSLNPHRKTSFKERTKIMNYIYKELPTRKYKRTNIITSKTKIVTVTNKNNLLIEKHLELLNLNDQNNIYSKISN